MTVRLHPAPVGVVVAEGAEDVDSRADSTDGEDHVAEAVAVVAIASSPTPQENR